MSSNTGEELRKVQVTGGSTFIISLPKAWVVYNNLKPGDIVEVIANDGVLIQVKKEPDAAIHNQR